MGEIMRKLIATILLTMIFLLIPIRLNAENETDLPVHKEGITQKQYNSVAITSKYNIDILTDNSEQIKMRNYKNTDDKTEELLNNLVLDNKNAEFLSFTPKNLPDTSDYLFTESNSYVVSDNSEMSNKHFNTVLCIVILVLSGILSCLFTLIHMNKKRRKKADVYYYYNYNKQ